MGQGRAGLKRRKPDPISEATNQPSKVSQEIPRTTKIVTGKTNSIHSTNSANDSLINNSPFMPDVPFHPDPLLRNLKQHTIKQNIQEINPKKLILILKKIHPFKKASCWETFQRLEKSFFQNSKEL